MAILCKEMLDAKKEAIARAEERRHEELLCKTRILIDEVLSLIPTCIDIIDTEMYLHKIGFEDRTENLYYSTDMNICFVNFTNGEIGIKTTGVGECLVFAKDRFFFRGVRIDPNSTEYPSDIRVFSGLDGDLNDMSAEKCCKIMEKFVNNLDEFMATFLSVIK